MDKRIEELRERIELLSATYGRGVDVPFELHSKLSHDVMLILADAGLILPDEVQELPRNIISPTEPYGKGQWWAWEKSVKAMLKDGFIKGKPLKELLCGKK